MTQIKERPILFSADMVRAILDGRKTQTRRLFKAKNGGVWPNKNDLPGMQQILRGCPYGKPGDRLWVREAWSTHSCFDHMPHQGCPLGLFTIGLTEMLPRGKSAHPSTCHAGPVEFCWRWSACAWKSSARSARPIASPRVALAAMAQYLGMRMPPPPLSITGRCGIPSTVPGITMKTHGCGWLNFVC